MIEKALARFDIDPSRSFMLGDKQRDIDCAQKAGVKGFLVDINKNIKPYVDNILNTEHS